MSGPKVVRIMTREELEAICRRHLRSVGVAIAQIERCARKCGAWDEALELALQDRHTGFTRLFEQERWIDIQQQAPVQVEFLRSELQRINSAAIERAGTVRQQRRRMIEAARSMAQALESAGREVPEPLSSAIRQSGAVRDDDVAAIESALNEGLKQLGAPQDASGISEQQHAMATRLSEGEETQSYTAWLALQQVPDREEDRRLDRLLAEIEVLDERSAEDEPPPYESAASPFNARAAAIFAETDANRRALLTDSLTLDVGAQVAKARAWQQHLIALEEARATLEGLQAGAAVPLLARLEAAITEQNTAEAAAVEEAARMLAEAEHRREASQSRRLAILQGLASLGYEIREEMTAGWASSGRIVVRRPGVTDYGLELGAVADAARMQMRVVGSADPAEPRTADRDRDVEARWCAEMPVLQGALAAAGSDFVIEQAVAAGVQPVKTIVMERPEESAAMRRTKPLVRSLD